MRLQCDFVSWCNDFKRINVPKTKEIVDFRRTQLSITQPSETEALILFRSANTWTL